MSQWTPMLVLPNLAITEPVGDFGIAVVNVSDSRVLEHAAEQPNVAEFLKRFSTAFGRPVEPTVLIVKEGTPYHYKDVAALAGFRDVLAASTILAGRALSLTHNSAFGKPLWAETFEFYPWMVNRFGDQLLSMTPALTGIHDVHNFHGQSKPAFPILSITPSAVEAPLFDELLGRWHRRFSDDTVDWEDRALFRSLNLAYHAMLMPGGVEHGFYDVGRLLTLWVSAFEVLLHPGPGGALGETQVLNALDGAPWLDPHCAELAHPVKIGKTTIDRTLGAKFCHLIYQLRNDFMHGNPVDETGLTYQGKSLFQLIGSLYRMALTGFLDLRFPPPPDTDEPDELGQYLAARMLWHDPQRRHEAAILSVAGISK